MTYFLKKILLPVLFLLTVALMYGQLLVWKQQWIGILVFVSFTAITSEWWRHILQHVFAMKRKTWTATVLAYFASFLLLGLSVSVAINWYVFNPIVLWSCFVATGVLSWLLYILTQKHRAKDSLESDIRAHIFSQPVFSKRLIIPLLYVVLWLVGAMVLFKSSSLDVLLSPWQTISPYYLLIFFLLTWLLGIMVFSYYGTKVMLFFLVLHGLLLHSYLPLSHANPWGGDVWRHISVERQLERGDVIKPVLFGAGAEWRDVGSVSLPEVLFHPQKYAYGHLWGSTLTLSETLRIDLVTVNKWLVPILWSLVMPFLLFCLGRQLFRSPRAALCFAWLSFLPFPLQALGTLSLPVSLGLLLFLFTLTLFLSFVESRDRRQLGITLLFAVLMLFSYPLYSIVMWVIILLGSVITFVPRYTRSITVGLLVVAVVLLPALEIVSRSSHLPAMWQGLEALKRLAGEWSGWYFASQIRPHDIVSGNIMFNHTPVQSFVAGPFTSWRWHIPFLLFVMWIGIGFGIVKGWQERQSRSKIMLLLFSLLFGGYLVGWYVLDGDRLLIRRTDALLALTMLIVCVFGIKHMRDIAVLKHKRIVVLLFIIVCSWFATTVYASGPDMRVMSTDEYTAAHAIWDTEKENDKHCVLADTWVLLALEDISAGSIIGGGFPMDYQFGQPERVGLYESLRNKPETDLITQAKGLTGASSCVIAIDELSPSAALTELFGKEPETHGGIFVWQGIEK